MARRFTTVGLLCAGVLLAGASGLPAQAQSVADFYRGKTVNVLIGVGVGGEYDLQARLVARHIGKHIPGNPLVVPQNMTGAGGEEDPVGATSRVLAALTAMVSADDTSEPLRFTAALANGRDLYAFRYAANDKANTLYYRQSGDSVVIVSEPLDGKHAQWKTVPPGHMVAAVAGKPVKLEPFLTAQRVAAE